MLSRFLRFPPSPATNLMWLYSKINRHLSTDSAVWPRADKKPGRNLQKCRPKVILLTINYDFFPAQNKSNRKTSNWQNKRCFACFEWNSQHNMNRDIRTKLEGKAQKRETDEKKISEVKLLSPSTSRKNNKFLCCPISPLRGPFYLWIYSREKLKINIYSPPFDVQMLFLWDRGNIWQNSNFFNNFGAMIKVLFEALRSGTTRKRAHSS